MYKVVFYKELMERTMFQGADAKGCTVFDSRIMHDLLIALLLNLKPKNQEHSQELSLDEKVTDF